MLDSFQHFKHFAPKAERNRYVLAGPLLSDWSTVPGDDSRQAVLAEGLKAPREHAVSRHGVAQTDSIVINTSAWGRLRHLKIHFQRKYMIGGRMVSVSRRQDIPMLQHFWPFGLRKPHPYPARPPASPSPGTKASIQAHWQVKPTSPGAYEAEIAGMSTTWNPLLISLSITLNRCGESSR